MRLNLVLLAAALLILGSIPTSGPAKTGPLGYLLAAGDQPSESPSAENPGVGDEEPVHTEDSSNAKDQDRD
jgi:hypothetical protein